MRKVQCGECGKNYDYDEDAFCPKCGAFNQPAGGERAMRITRKDGLSEAGHEGSFLHREYHEEEKARRRTGLDKGADRASPAPPRSEKPKTARINGTERKSRPSAGKIIKWIIVGYFALTLLSSIISACAHMLW